jgi:hypothetical protein
LNLIDFPPPRQRGLAIHTALVVSLALLIAVFAWLASRQPVGPLFILFILLAAIFFFPFPVLVYRLYALQRANYSLDRDKLSITWGLRVEQIPISDIEWVRPMDILAVRPPLPFFRLPGSVVGVRHHPEFGTVEYIASDEKLLLLVATSSLIFAISPSDPTNFTQTIQRAIEMGSLSPSAPRSVYPSFVVAQAWGSALARYLWLAGLFLNIGLLAWVSLIAPSLGRVPLGFQPSGAPGQPVPAVALMLVPAVSIFLYAVGWVAGLAFYRREDHRTLAHLVWASGVISALLFLVAVMLLVTSPA